ncbi:MAG TPA: hypothetical protein VF992_08785 [Thermoplasmata archaeon]
MSRALKAVKRAKERGVDVRPARATTKECAKAFRARDYDRVVRLAEDLIERMTGGGGSLP